MQRAKLFALGCFLVLTQAVAQDTAKNVLPPAHNQGTTPSTGPAALPTRYGVGTESTDSGDYDLEKITENQLLAGLRELDLVPEVGVGPGVGERSPILNPAESDISNLETR